MQWIVGAAAAAGLFWLLGSGGAPTTGTGESGGLLQQVNRDRISAETETWVGEVQSAAQAAGVPADILLALVQQESSGDPDATGPGGETGLTQLKQIAVDDVAQNTPLPPVDVQTLDARNPQKNLQYGAEFLALQRSRVANASDMDGWFDALRSYNCGFGGARQSAGCGSNYAHEVLDRAGRGLTS